MRRHKTRSAWNFGMRRRKRLPMFMAFRGSTSSSSERNASNPTNRLTRARKSRVFIHFLRRAETSRKPSRFKAPLSNSGSSAAGSGYGGGKAFDLDGQGDALDFRRGRDRLRCSCRSVWVGGGARLLHDDKNGYSASTKPKNIGIESMNELLRDWVGKPM